MSPVQMTFVANLAPEHLRGTYMGLQVCSGLQEMHLVHFLGVLLDRLLGHFLFTILAIGCVVAIYNFGLHGIVWLRKLGIYFFSDGL